MAISLSFKELVVISVSVFSIVLGIFFLFQISLLKNNIAEIPLPFLEKDLSVDVFPQSSQQGTVFLVRAERSKINEGQNLRLLVEGENYTSSISLYDDGQHSDGEENDGIYGGFFDSSSKDIGIYDVSDGEDVKASFSVSSESCELVEGRYKDSYKFLIIPSGYTDYDEFRRDAINSIRGAGSIISVQPFSSERTKISFSVLNTSRDFECRDNCKGVSTIVCCNDLAVSEEASKCTHDGVIVLYKSENLCGSSSSYAKVCSQNKLTPMALMHELGHSFGGLADEYIYSNYSIGKINAPNCDISGCEKWGGEGCYEGCTYSDLYRQEEKKSIMYTFYPGFNEVSRNHLKNLIESYSDIKSSDEMPLPGKSYTVPLKYNNGSISLGDVFLKPIETSLLLRNTVYSAAVLDGNGNKLFETNISLPLINEPLPDSSSYPVLQDDFEYYLSIPYYSEGMKIEILNGSRKKSEVNVGGLAQMCGNGVCNEGENHVSCSIDCTIEEDNFCQEGVVCDPNCKDVANNCYLKQNIYLRTGILLIAISLISIVSVAYRIYRKRILKDRQTLSNYRN